MKTSDRITTALAVATAAFVSVPGTLQAQVVTPGTDGRAIDGVPINGGEPGVRVEVDGGFRHRGGITWDRDFFITRSGGRDIPALRLRDDPGPRDFELDVEGREAFIDVSLFGPRFNILLNLERTEADGDFTTGGLVFDEGLGVPFVGSRPGLFFGGPQAGGPYQVNQARFDTDREGWAGTLAFGINPDPISKATVVGAAVLGIGPFIGFQLGDFDQDERFWAETTFTNFPEFSTDVWYNTNFDTDFVGGILGATVEYNFALQGALRLLLAGEAAYLIRDYDVTIHDAVRLEGFQNAEDSIRFTHENTLHGYDANGSIGIGMDSWDVSVGGGVTNMVPKFVYARPDSTPEGEPLPPRAKIDNDTTWSVEVRGRLRFGRPPPSAPINDQPL